MYMECKFEGIMLCFLSKLVIESNKQISLICCTCLNILIFFVSIVNFESYMYINLIYTFSFEYFHEWGK